MIGDLKVNEDLANDLCESIENYVFSYMEIAENLLVIKTLIKKGKDKGYIASEFEKYIILIKRTIEDMEERLNLKNEVISELKRILEKLDYEYVRLINTNNETINIE